MKVNRGESPCPVCDKPIADTAYVCSTCADQLATDLSECAVLWGESELTLTRQSRTTGGIGGGGRDLRVTLGPFCEQCEHLSCESAVHSQMRARMAGEPPLPNEETMPMHYGASEARWAAGNTITTWARHVSEERGLPIPEPLKPPVITSADRWPTDDEREQRCPMSDLLPSQCACPLHRRTA